MITLEKTGQRAGTPLRTRARKGKGLPGFVNMGSTLLLVVFLVITLVVFALLALSGAKSDLEFAQGLARQRTAYYEACSRSEEILAALRDPAAETEDFPESLVTNEGEIYQWTVDIDENRKLFAEYDRETGNVLTWQVQPARPWEGEQKIWNP